MNEQNVTEPGPDKKHQRDRKTRLVFLVALVAVAVAIYLLQRSSDEFGRLEGWGDNLQSALKQAENEDRRVIAFFMNDKPGENARWMAKLTLMKSHNRKAVKDGGYVCVKVRLAGGLKSAEAKRYKLTALPTLLMLGADGNELKDGRREGRVGEMVFRKWVSRPQ